MSNAWDCIFELSSHFEITFSARFTSLPVDDRFNTRLMKSLEWTSTRVRKAHLSVIDDREHAGIALFHCCIFPDFGVDAPIFGCDIVAGKNKITGAFLDFSPTTSTAYVPPVSTYSWSRVRQVPDWGKDIFSESFLAIGNIQENETEQLQEQVYSNLDLYLKLLQDAPIGANTKYRQSLYCRQQKKNPRLTTRFMVDIGLTDELATLFVQEKLF